MTVRFSASPAFAQATVPLLLLRIARSRGSAFCLAVAFALTCATPNIVSAQEAEDTITVIDAEKLDTPPELRRKVKVRYPGSVRRKGGEITLRFRVTAEGRVGDLTIVRFSDPEMVEPAYEAYLSARFTPAQRDGKAVDSWVQVVDTTK